MQGVEPEVVAARGVHLADALCQHWTDDSLIDRLMSDAPGPCAGRAYWGVYMGLCAWIKPSRVQELAQCMAEYLSDRESAPLARVQRSVVLSLPGASWRPNIDCDAFMKAYHGGCLLALAHKLDARADAL